MEAEGVGVVDVVEVLYCEGWDPEARAAVAPLAEAEARRRDGNGEPYAVLLSHQGRPKALFQVDWRHAYLGLFLFDAHGRRTVAYEYRQLEPGRLHLNRFRQWGHSNDTEPEFPKPGVRFELTVRPDGRGRRTLDTGASLQMGTDVPAEHRTVAKSEFGAWTAYIDLRALGPGSPSVVVSEPSSADAPAPGDGDGAGAGALWSAPMPLRPEGLEELFTPGVRLACGEDRTALIGEPAPAGLLHLPTGSLAARDPGVRIWGEDDLGFTVTVPPGDYPVLVSTMRWEQEDWDGETPAAMVRILDEPTVGWELALMEGQDGRLLGEGQFYGFGVDTGTACFMDASGRDALPELYEGAEPAFEEGVHSCTVADPASGTNLIAFPSGFGDGSYPVWIGRAASGAVTCFVADMLVLHGAEPLPPTVRTPAPYSPPFQGLIDDRREAPFTDPGATSEFIAGLIGELVRFRRERDAVR
ncbi:DUF4241 domain-containing protein [Streptomyces sp. NPDC085524]|uniref:DUF4241 domain-containing protein n=1 Tax=Streptomyces sp. NPDC085524 TaxID=3365728 RepID=UPI0037D88FB9